VNEWIQLLAAFLGSMAFAILFHIRGIKLLAAAFGGGLSWGLFLLLNRVVEKEAICYFIVAVLISFYAEIMARCLKAPVTVFVSPCLIPLVPGASLYYAMSYALGGGFAQGFERAIHTLALGSALAVGVIVSAVIMKLITGLQHAKKEKKHERV